MKILKYISVILLLCVFVFGACQPSNPDDTPDGPKVTENYVVQNGVSSYKVVVPAARSNIIDVASKELCDFFEEATSVRLDVVDDGTDISDNYISVGETSFLASSDISHNVAELGTDGYKIVTKGKNIFLVGGGDYGTLYSVYGLLEFLFDFDYFATDCYTIDKGVTDVPLYEFDITDIPDIASRTASDGVVEADSYSLYRLRVRPYLEDFITINGYWCHNSLQYVVGDERANSNWYSSDQTQLCYTAHGIESEYRNMLDAAFNKLKAELVAQPNKNRVTLTIEDNYDVCECDACTAIKEKYGAISASVILFVNDLDDLVDAWFASEDGSAYKRDLQILFFAYMSYEEAPVTYDEESGKYQFNGDLKLNDGVYCYLCPINMDYYKPITDDFNEQYYNTVRAWGDVADNKLYLWYYSTNFNYYLAPYDSFDSMQTNYRFAVECGTTYLFDLRQHNEKGFVTGWSTLKDYLTGKLAWDCDADVTALTKKFFTNYFGLGSNEMTEYFDSMRLLTNYNKDHNELGGLRSLYIDVVDEKYWPKAILQHWIDLCDAALEKIAPLETENPLQYATYKNRINGEKLSALYLYVECYSYNSDGAMISNYKNQFKQIADELNVSQYSENNTISTLYTKWGI